MEGESNPVIIEANIERTRAEMSGTIDAIQDRLDPEHLSEQAVATASQVADQARDVAKYAIDEAKAAVQDLAGQATTAVRASTVGRVEQMTASTRETARSMQGDMFTMIRQNPIPAALAAAGIGWLWMSRSSADPRSHGYSPYGRDDSSYGQGFSHGGERGWQSASPGQVAGQAQDMAGQALSQAQDTAGQAFSQAQGAAGQMQHQARSAVSGIAAEPVALGALGLIAGAVAGFILPETEQEHQLLGDARGRMADRVQEVAGQTMDTVQRVATEVGKTAVQEAQGAIQQRERPASASAS
jgi:hypothetical protein